MKYVKPIDPVTTCHLLQDNPENAAYYASCLIKSTKPEVFMKNSWFPHQRTLGHANPERDCVRITQPPRIGKTQSSRRPRVKMSDLTNFDWADSMLQPA